ncbi:hypothetical protein Purlil1_13821 [Purpureocillium lilacinum]|uniref:Reverse transcriptase n=1 Tax=Purpureocillium lilacinum TaxID=33203 RepID=A0ABR0BD26_PURLI|nr:hypothetical protein Purlil1_13821 [Purpureocillium lilacinum]
MLSTLQCDTDCVGAQVFTGDKGSERGSQQYVDSMHETSGVLRDQGNAVTATWVPVSSEHELLRLAKDEAREATRECATPAAKFPRAGTTTLGIARRKQRAGNKIPSNVGDFTKRVDGARPGKHTRQIVYQLTWKEANVLAQLRTGMARLNDYLYRIKASTSQQMTAFRMEMIKCTNTPRGNISFYLGGKQRSDKDSWTPNMEAVRATIRYAFERGAL